MRYLKKTLPLYFTFLIIDVGFIGIYSFLNWYFIIRTQADFISADLSNYWLPFALPAIPVFFVFWWKLKPMGVNLTTHLLITIMTTVCISAPAIIAQFYLKTATGKVAHLESISQVLLHPTTKYFTLKKYEIDKTYTGVYSVETSASRTSWDYEIFFASPVFETLADSAKDHCNAWVIKKYYKNFGEGSGHIQEREDEFWNESLKDFDKLDLNSFSYLGTLEFNDGYKNLVEAAKNSPKYSPSEKNIFFESFNNSYGEKNGNKLFWFFFSIAAGLAVFSLVLRYIVWITDGEK